MKGDDSVVFRFDMMDKTPQQQAIVSKRDENNKLLKKGNEVTYQKIKSNKVMKKSDIQARILTENGLKATKGTMTILDELWDNGDNFVESKIPEIIERIIKFQNETKRNNQLIVENASKDIESFGLKKDEDYSIDYAAKGNGINQECYISLTFRLKGNKKIIEQFETKNWVIDRKYRNDDGSPSQFKSDWFGKNCEFRYTMIVMKYIVDSLYL